MVGRPTGTVDLLRLTPGSGPSAEMDINDAGDVIANINGPISSAVIYRNGAWIDVNDLAPGNIFRMKTVTAINDNGWIVGSGGVGAHDRPWVRAHSSRSQRRSVGPQRRAHGRRGHADLRTTGRDRSGREPYSPSRSSLTGPSASSRSRDRATGAYSYAPAANAFGTENVRFKANDGTVDSNVATVTVTITPVNDTPIALDSSHSGVEDTPVGATLQASDPDGQALTFAVDAPPAKGTVTITNPATGAFNYVPNANANGTDTFTFTASDGTLTSLPGLFTIDVSAVNDPPGAVAGIVATSEDTAVTGQLAATVVTAIR